MLDNTCLAQSMAGCAVFQFIVFAMVKQIVLNVSQLANGDRLDDRSTSKWWVSRMRGP
jgi:hypothetical protein